MVGEREIYKEERDVLEEGMRKLDVCGMEESGRLERVARKRSLS